MHDTFNLTTAKAKLSSIISEVEFKGKKVFITKKGKNVAAIIPFNEYHKNLDKKVKNEGLILAKGALSELKAFDGFVETIKQMREKSTEREVKV